MRPLFACWLMQLMHAPAMAQDDGSDCGRPVLIATHGGTTTRYALSLPAANAPMPRAVLVLMVGHADDKFVRPPAARANRLNP